MKSNITYITDIIKGKIHSTSTLFFWSETQSGSRLHLLYCTVFIHFLLFIQVKSGIRQIDGCSVAIIGRSVFVTFKMYGIDTTTRQRWHNETKGLVSNVIHRVIKYLHNEKRKLCAIINCCCLARPANKNRIE